MIETIVDQDDAAMEAYLEGIEPDEETIKMMIRKGTISLSFVPVLCGSAFKNKGVQPLLDAVVAYLPSPLDLPPMKGCDVDNPDIPVDRKPSDDEPFSGLAFKIMNDSFVGSLTFVRIYSGTLAAGTYVLNSNKGKKERIGRLLEMHANSREDLKVARAGDIIALAGTFWLTPGFFHVQSFRDRFSLPWERYFKKKNSLLYIAVTAVIRPLCSSQSAVVACMQWKGRMVSMTILKLP